MKACRILLEVLLILLTIFSSVSFSQDAEPNGILPNLEKSKNHIASDLKIEFDLTWTGKGSVESPGGEVSKQWQYTYREKAVVNTRIYYKKKLDQGELGEIIVAGASFDTIPVSYSAQWRNITYGMEWTGGAASLIPESEGHNWASLGGEGRDADEFEIGISGAHNYIKLEVHGPMNDVSTKIFRPGAPDENSNNVTFITNISGVKFSYKELLSHSATRSVNEEFKNTRTEPGIGTIYDEHNRVTGQVILSLNPGESRCDPFYGLREGTDYMFIDIADRHTAGQALWATGDGYPIVVFDKKYWSTKSKFMQNMLMAHEAEHRKQYLEGNLPTVERYATEEDHKKGDLQSFRGELAAFYMGDNYVKNCVADYREKAKSDPGLLQSENILLNKDGSFRDEADIRETLEHYGYVYHF